jgi:iron complex outermembrane receptor protein
VPDYAAWQYDALNGGGVDREYNQEKRNQLLEFYANYVKEVESIKSNFDVMAGYSYQRLWRKGATYETNLPLNNDTANLVVRENTDYATENVLISFYGRINYTLMGRYLVTFTLRNDQTSRFSPDTRSGVFPSVALAWKIKDESFLRDVKVLSQLKLRLGWGVTGQQNINQGDYPYLPRYTYSEANARYQLGQIFYQTLRAEGYDANIKWEETTTINAGIDFGFADDRYYGSIDVYQRKTEDLINFIPVPAGSNLTNFILTNIGNLENRGIEFSIYTRPVVTEKVNWTIGANASYNENKITKLTASDDPSYLGVETGGIAGGVGNNIQIHSVGHPSSSFFVYEQVYGSDGKPIQGMYVDRNGDGEISGADRYHYKKPAADWWFGINSAVSWNNWEFSFSGRANIGNYVYNNVASENGVFERLYRPEGPYLSNIASSVFNTNFVNPQYLSDYYIQDGSFFRMDYMTLSYFFPSLGKTKLKLRISGTVNNAFVITGYDGLDPEIPSGIDNNIYPRPRVYVLGINLQF